MAKHGREKIIGISMVMLIMVAIFVILLPRPTGDWQLLYIQLRNETAGDGPAIGLGGIDPLTDIVVPRIGRVSDIAFLIIAPNRTGDRVDVSTIGYRSDTGVDVESITVTKLLFTEAWMEDWDAYIVILSIWTPQSGVYHLTITAGNERGDTSSRIFIVTPMG